LFDSIPELKQTIAILVIFLLCSFQLISQSKISTEEYIRTYKDVAIKKMKEYGIPASITLAQGILESGSGNSGLARKANNHFGIKCHKGWTGKTYHMDDDAKNECFRKYGNPADSYRDHSLFLTQRDRYAFLFDYDVTDYKSWARGLKKAGYATNPKYPQLLISLIERYDLAQYDTGKKKKTARAETPAEAEPVPVAAMSGSAFVENKLPVTTSPAGRSVYEINRAKFIVTKQGDTFFSIAEEFDIYSWQLYKYNDLDKGHVLQADELIYLEKKRKKAEKSHKNHVVEDGETLRTISNTYAVRMSSLRKLNSLQENTQPTTGMVLKLR
jgi:LysM repeat protein